MSRKLTHEEFIEKSKIIHKDKYDYSQTKYDLSINKINIICKKHGLFSVKAGHHLEGRGCIKCGRLVSAKKKTITLKEFIKRGKAKYNNEHTYEKSKYVNCDTRIFVTCKLHGDFDINPSVYLNKPSGCPKCKKCSFDRQNSKNGFSRTEWFNNCGEGNSYLYLVKLYNENESFYKIGISKNTFKRYRSWRKRP